MNTDSIEQSPGRAQTLEDSPEKSKAETDHENQDNIDDEDSESEEEVKEEGVKKREDVFVCFTNDKDLRHYESIRVKAQYYTGIAIRTKNITPQFMENITKAIDVDNNNVRKKLWTTDPKNKGLVPTDNDLAALTLDPNQSIVNLRIEEARLSNRAVHSLTFWLKNKHLLHSIGLIKIRFDDKHSFKLVLDAIQASRKLTKVSIAQMSFDGDFHGQKLGMALKHSSSITELNIEQVSFDHPKSFCDLCLSLVDKTCRIKTLKLKGILFTTLEVKVLQFLIMRNQSITTVDLSECIDESRNNFPIFLQKFDAYSRVKFLTIDNMQPDLHNSIETLGEALTDNMTLEVLNMRGNKIKNAPYQNFWNIMKKNTFLKKINCSKTELNDKVVEALGLCLESKTIRLQDIDLSRNNISDVGMRPLCLSLIQNTSLTTIHLEGNNIKSEGCLALAEYLQTNQTLQELNLAGNKINNEGIAYLSQMLTSNTSLLFLDISRNAFNDQGFDVFAAGLERNMGLEYLDVSKNKDISDEGGLITLAESLARNKKLKTLDVSGIRLRKPFLKSHLELALQSNITLIDVIGKIPPGTIEGDLGINVKIRDQIYPCYQEKPKIHKRMKFNFTLVDTEDYSFLDISGKKTSYILPSFKFMNFYHIRAIDLAGTGFHDIHMSMLGEYLQSDPELFSICLDNNPLTDASMKTLANALRKNKKVAHLSLCNCPNITDKGLEELYFVIMDHNMVLFQIDIDIEKFDQTLAHQLIEMSALNRDIQQKLKPKYEIRKTDFAGEKSTVNNFQAGVFGMPKSNQDKPKPQSSWILGQADSAGQKELEAEKVVSSGSSLLFGQKVESTTSTMFAKLGTSANKIQADDEISKNVQRIVNFDLNAPIAECFQSVLKVYRIMKPDTIILENKELEDKHIIALVDFLDKKEMCKTLNLRRNNIGNVGAIALAEFIIYKDDSMVEVNLNRNRITNAGIERLLDAVHATIRLQKFGISFGNHIDASQVAAFEQEIKANLKIKKNLKNQIGKEVGSILQLHDEQDAAANFRKMKYEIIDKGQNYMRCAVKTTQLLDILHLSLPDNLLTFADAELIAGMLRKNTSLRILNLSQNNFDFNAGRIIGDSLLYNNHLQSLNMSYNRLGDLGVRNLLWGLTILGCRQQGVNQQSTEVQIKIDLDQKQQQIEGNDPLKRSSTIKGNQAFMDARRGTMLACESTALQALNLKENYMTQESLRHIWLMLEVNQNTAIEISKPYLFNWNYVEDAPSDQVIDQDSSLKHDYRQDSSRQGLFSQESNADVEDSMEDYDSQEEQERLVKQKRAECRKKCRDNCIGCLKKLACFHDHNQEFSENRQVKFKQVCCWRFFRSRQATIQFETSDAIRKGLLAKCFRFQIVAFYINYVMLLLCCIIPFLLLVTNGVDKQLTSSDFGTLVEFDDYQEDWKQLFQEKLLSNIWLTLFFYACFVVYTLLYEAIFCIYISVKMEFKCSKNLCFLVSKLLSSTLRRIQVLLQSLLAAEFFVSKNIISNVFALILTLLLVCSQIKSFRLITKTATADYEKNILTYLERLQRSAKVTGHEAINILLFKMSIRPNSNMERQADRLSDLKFENRSEEFVLNEQNYYKLEEDTQAARAERHCFCKNTKVAQFCLNYESTRFWSLCCNTIPVAGCALILSYLSEIEAYSSHYLIFGLLSLFSFFQQIMVLNQSHPISIVDADKVYEKTLARLEEKKEIYEDLMSENPNLESEVSVHDTDQKMGTDSSFDLLDGDKETNRVNAKEEVKNVTNDTQEVNTDFAQRKNNSSAKVAPDPSSTDANKDLKKLIQVQETLDAQLSRLSNNQTDLDIEPVKQKKRVGFQDTPPTEKQN